MQNSYLALGILLPSYLGLGLRIVVMIERVILTAIESVMIESVMIESVIESVVSKNAREVHSLKGSLSILLRHRKIIDLFIAKPHP